MGDQPEALEFWGKVVGEYVALGWNPKNVAGMLEWFERKELPRVTQKGNNKSKTRADRNNEIIASWFEGPEEKQGEEEQWMTIGNVEVQL